MASRLIPKKYTKKVGIKQALAKLQENIVFLEKCIQPNLSRILKECVNEILTAKSSRILKEKYETFISYIMLTAKFIWSSISGRCPSIETKNPFFKMMHEGFLTDVKSDWHYEDEVKYGNAVLSRACFEFVDRTSNFPALALKNDLDKLSNSLEILVCEQYTTLSKKYTMSNLPSFTYKTSFEKESYKFESTITDNENGKLSATFASEVPVLDSQLYEALIRSPLDVSLQASTEDEELLVKRTRRTSVVVNSDDELEVRSKSAALAPSIEVLKYIFTVLYTYFIYWKCISKILQQVPVLD